MRSVNFGAGGSYRRTRLARLGHSAPAGHSELLVADTGAGIHASEAARVFERFHPKLKASSAGQSKGSELARPLLEISPTVSCQIAIVYLFSGK